MDADALFSTPESTVAALAGGTLLQDSGLNRLLRVETPHCAYYVKVYRRRGRFLRRFAFRSRARAEWENLQFFATLGIPTPRVVAFGESNQTAGIVVTEEAVDTIDLAKLAGCAKDVFNDKKWRRGIASELADYVRRLHARGFAHNDLKWRNVLVRRPPGSGVLLIDCPGGRRLPWPFRERANIKDLACLDKMGRQYLSRSDRLYFYFSYEGIGRLTPHHKERIRRIAGFFDGRE